MDDFEDDKLESVEPVPQNRFMEQSKSMVEQLATAQIQSRYTMAAKFNRNIEQVRVDMLRECKRPSFCIPDPKKNGSSVAIYRVPRGNVKGEDGKWVQNNIEGVTIRFAEMAARGWGHLSIDVTPLGEDETQRIYQVMCTDYQTNNTGTEIVSVPKTIERSKTKPGDVVISQRTNSYGNAVFTVLSTEDEMAMKRNALISKARRNLILQVIPGWLVEECIDRIRATAAEKDAEDPDAAKRKLFDAFAGVGVTPQMLNEFIGHSKQLAPAEMEDLRGYYGALREGYTTWAEIAASKGDAQDDATAKRIEELLSKSGRTPAVTRKLKGQYIGRAAELLKFLEEEAAKKADTGSAPEQQKAEPAKKAETEVPADLKETAQANVTAQTQQTNRSAPPAPAEEW